MTGYKLSGLLDWGSSQDVGMIRGRLFEAWRRFLEGDALDGRLVRPVIREAWERCRANKVDFNLEKAPSSDSSADAINREDASSVLLEEASSALISLGNTLKDKQCVAALCDVSGRIIVIEGDPRFAGEIAERKNFRVGVRWSEKAAGNNAIGTALSIGRPHQVVSAEHYCRGWHDYVCTAVPICDPFSEKVLGVLDITGTLSSFHRHAYGQVLNAVRIIETTLCRKGASREYFFNREALRAINAMSSEGLVIVDSNGAIRACSPAAKALLKEIPLAGDHDLLTLIHGLLTGKRLPTDGVSEDSVRARGRTFPVQIHPLVRDKVHLGTVIRFLDCKAPVRKRLTRKSSRVVEAIVGTGSSLETARVKATKVANYDTTVLLEGESGTGKELFARLIHERSPRSGGPFVPVNCASIPSELLASELFGYESGSFTGARAGGRIGKFESGNQGTIFLDEVSEIPMHVQVILLRFLQEKEFYRVGGTRMVRPDVRIIAATNKPLKHELAEGRFREDLFYRLKVVRIKLPPLRNRREDIPELVEFFLRDLCSGSGRPVGKLDEDAMSAVMAYSWPGNVRELRNAVEHGLVMSEGDIIRARDLPEEVVSAEVVESPVAPRAEGDGERDRLLAALEGNGRNISLTARKLGMARVTLYRRMKRLGITVVKQMSHH
jgi:transcriptional regulator of acetoin/glycerol metabolism